MPNQRQLAETLFERNHGRDAEISQALQQEEAARCYHREYATLAQIAATTG
jgi:hypothetical protein